MAEPSISTAVESNTAVQDTQPDYRDTISCKIQNIGGFLIQICEVLADNTSTFFHVLVLLDRSYRFDRWGGDFFHAGLISKMKLARSARSAVRAGSIEGLLEKERVLRRFLERCGSGLVAHQSAWIPFFLSK